MSADGGGNPEGDMAFVDQERIQLVDYDDYESSSFSPKVVLKRKGRGEKDICGKENFKGILPRE